MPWIEEAQYRDDETVLVYFRGVGLTGMTEGLIAQHRPPFAYGKDPEPGDWGVIVHHMYNPSRDDFGWSTTASCATRAPS